MGRSNSMSPAKLQRAESFSAPPRVDDVEKPVHHDNPVEPVRVKLQDPVGYPPADSLWSSGRLKTRSSLLFSTSQGLNERPTAFALRAPRVQTNDAGSPQATPPSEQVDNQKEDQDQYEKDAAADTSDGQPWGAKQPQSKDKQPIDNQDEARALPRNLLGESTNAKSPSVDHQRADIWTNPHDDFKDSEFIGSATRSATVSPTSSPDKAEMGPVVSFPLSSPPTSNRTVPTSSSHGESKTQAGACRAPPGMSLIDRIQEDFPRTPSPEYGQFEDGGSTVRRYSFAEPQTPSMFDIGEGMGQLRLGNNYRSAPQYGAGRRPNHEFMDLPRTTQHVAGPRFAGVNAHRYNFGRSTSEPPFGGHYNGGMAQGFPSSYAVGAQGGAQGYSGMMGAGKPRWSTTEDAYAIPTSPFGFAPTDFANALPGHNGNMMNYPAGYTGEFRGIKPNDKVFKSRPTYPPVDHQMYECREFGNYMPRPQMQHRPKVGGPRRNEFEYFHPIAHSYSSNSLLEEFNSAPKSEKWGLSAIKGHLFIFAKDQTGSRFIQQKLEKADDQLKAEAFNEIFPNSLLLMTDVFGNYVIQKFLEYGTLQQQQLLVELMTSNMISLALQVYGCRVIQRALEVTQVDEQLSLIQQLKGHVMKCVVDQNGNHVLQKCIEAASWKRAAEYNGLGIQRFVTGEDIQFIIDSFVGHAAALSTHSYGCRVIQRVLEHCAPDQIRPLLSEIIFKCRELVKDQFGNYVVQHVISHGEPDQRNIVMQAVFPEIARWSQHKYASNVVEACLEHANKQEISQIVEFILQCDESGSSCALLPMMKHMYGNYVVQKLLERADDRDRQRIVCIIRHNEDYLKRFTFGKHVLSRLDREDQTSSYY
ncbi:hypothetical protein JM18_001656 [Phytophthora kernoviae]|uniref:PUM-HD domain-containing protein n=1 Tax=Phytophthora kernoviae TaxID=325452 RepID=A0A8T0M8V4_9STRA|nr:hypothetical protein JM16_000877 [Phytophthora kernoviae]KAG2531301.1 hypothetical protein JM18_001656 [Phytophthora kernoviae]